ncbi:MAG: histidine kinase [Geobacteraceae bacterium GWC2_58_44]|nr:MAG: histidine kinase [Geobacteraceae bacterium GWC2_58_44]
MRQLETELVERIRLEGELHHVNRALELQFTNSCAELAAVNEELRREKHSRAEEQKEISVLRENLFRQKKAFDVVSQELDSFSYSVSHDLRAPLRHMIGFSGVLLEDFRDSLDATAQSYLDCIVRSGLKMEGLIEALLKLSRVTRQELRLASVDLSELARACAASLQESAPERRAVISIADQLSVRADAELLKAAMDNLLQNAWKYTSKKETATIELGHKQEGDARIFFLRDNGAGFDMRFADRLFGPFQKMHREGEFEGMGIGLATVQRIIHRHGGRIWADAAVDAGATFFFTLSD